jgi:hypothetical protein
MTKFTQREMRNRFWVQVVAVRGRGRNAFAVPWRGRSLCLPLFSYALGVLVVVVRYRVCALCACAEYM